MLQARSAEEAECEEILTMTQEAFRKAAGGRSTGELERNIVEATVTADPNFRKGDLRIVETEGKIVSMMLIIRRQARIGRAIVNNAIVSPVATRVGHEKKGYCSTVMRDAINYMKQQEFDITTLWGHPWLYIHYGYSPAMMGPSVAIKPERCKPTEVKGTFTIQPYEETRAREVTDIYHKNTINQVLAEIRNPEPFEWKMYSPNVEFQTVIDKEGRVIGYYSITKTVPSGRNLLEVGVANTGACKIIFNKLLDYAREKKLAELVCPMSPQHPFAQFAYWQNAELRITMASGAGFAQILNMTTLFGKMKKELESRLNHSEFCNKTLSLAIKTEKETINLLVNSGGITVSTDEEKADCTVETPLSSLNPLVTGYKNIYELVQKKEATINSSRASAQDLNNIRLVDVLLPKGTPYGSNLPLVWE
ncbi:GNAT family N-acetyltransferase [Candidatus Bathyarchaeota archaeon]|nr:GNAT family N-acetyltransferase [Candidatus Bathyarchaeota archaeon]